MAQIRAVLAISVRQQNTVDPLSVLPLDTEENSLEVIGGKGRSLSRLVRAGFKVPDGFHVPTTFYRSFIALHSLEREILALARPVVENGGMSFEPASAAIHHMFASRDLPADMHAAITSAYNALPGTPAVAVRSSANAEDLPDLSFAGQQETLLNVTGADAVALAVKRCWASLWTSQALSYRHEMNVENERVAMAIVVQVMVPAEVSGILFTANPTTGERSEMIVNCSFGLGEAVVSGQVTPDTFVVDRNSLATKNTVIGLKERMIIAGPEQGTRIEDVPETKSSSLSLTAADLSHLVSAARTVEHEFDSVPQDIEWALANGELWLLQARPITNLPIAPPRDVTWPEIQDAQLLKRQVAENMPDPLSPLFEDLYLRAIYDTQTWPAGWKWQGGLTKNYMKNFVVTTVNGYAYQAIYQDNGKDWSDYMEKFRQERTGLPWYTNLIRTFSQGEFFLNDMKGGSRRWVYLLVRTFRTLRRFPAIVFWEKRQLPAYLAAIRHWRQFDPTQLADTELINGLRALSHAEAAYWHSLRSVIGTAKMTDGALQTFLEKNAPDEGLISGTFLSGFSSRALDAERAMRAIVDSIRNNSTLNELTICTPARRLLYDLQQHPEGAPICSAIRMYLQSWGKQVFNLDFVEPALAEMPLPFAVSLKALVQEAGYDLATRQKAVAKNRRAKWRHALSFFKGKQRIKFLQLYLTARINYPAREKSLFYMGLAWTRLRILALELGQRLVAADILGQPDDVFYLSSKDLEAAIHAEGVTQTEFASKASAQRELRATRFRMNPPANIPPIKDNNNPQATMRNNQAGDKLLFGFAVSPGQVTGPACVIRSPAEFDKMKPGSILVCPLTTPAWTQLFPHAKGLVTDIGSILAHGSIVAREYGIPAVLGVGDATQQIRSGQTITVDGDRGTVSILDEVPATDE